MCLFCGLVGYSIVGSIYPPLNTDHTRFNTDHIEELNQCKADYSDCFDADAMRNRLLTTLLIQAQNEAGPSPSNIPRAALALSPARTGHNKEVLCARGAVRCQHGISRGPAG